MSSKEGGMNESGRILGERGIGNIFFRYLCRLSWQPQTVRGVGMEGRHLVSERQLWGL